MQTPLKLALSTSVQKSLFQFLNLFNLLPQVDAVICCRVAPKQKAFVVKTVLANVKDLITASIGDGANDVAMIQEAHVGIGIRGVEGTQAVQASDFAISQFRFLQALLLDHGRGAYRRVAMFMCYYFYKNIALVMCDAIYAWFNGYSGTILFWDWWGFTRICYLASRVAEKCDWMKSVLSGPQYFIMY